MFKLLVSRSVYDQMLSRFKKIGQLTNFDIRNTDNIYIKDGITIDTKRKYVCVTAITETTKGNRNSVLAFREITVYENGQIIWQEGNSESSFTRQKIIFTSGDCALSYIDKNKLDCGYSVLYFANGDVYRGEKYKGKWHGQCEKNYADGRKEIGYCFNDKQFGSWRITEKDGKRK